MTTTSFTRGGMPFSVQICADSVSKYGSRITTFVLTYPRFIHAQMMTHRMLSRNAQSSRAMPVSKMLEETPVIPTGLRYNQKGMQPAEPLSLVDQEKAFALLVKLHDQTTKTVKALDKLGVHKQWANRYLEPFRTITAIYTGTAQAWAGFFDLRAHPDAQEEICWLAEAMQKLYTANYNKTERTEQHLPFIREEEKVLPLLDKFKLSSARCARVSYLTFDGKRDLEKDFELHDRLSKASPPHLSPLEHCAIGDSTLAMNANFFGWKSYRYMLEQEYLTFDE